MLELGASAAALRITGEVVDPDEINRLLNCLPSDSYRTGDILRLPSGKELTARTGYWTLEAEEVRPGDLNVQVLQILRRLPVDLSVWESLTKRFKVELYCGLFTQEWNEWIAISPETLGHLGSRGIELVLELYSGPMPTD
jgi:hypothetical protein